MKNLLFVTCLLLCLCSVICVNATAVPESTTMPETTSAKDYAKIISMLLKKGRGMNGAKILSESAVKAIEVNRFKAPKYGVGYGVQFENNVLPGKTVLVHTGSAYGMFSAYVFVPGENAGVVVLTSGCRRAMDGPSEVYYICLDLIKAVYPVK